MTCILIREQTTVTERSLQIRCSSQNDPFLKRPLSHLWTSVRSCISISWAHFEHVFICAKQIRHMPRTVAFQAPKSVYCTRWNETLQRSRWRMHAAQKWMFPGRRSSNFWLKACAQTQGFELLAFCSLPNQTWCLDVFGRFQALVCKLRYSKEMCALIWYMFMKWPSTQFVHVIRWRVYLFRVAMRDDHAAFWWSFCAKPMGQSLCRLYAHPRIKKNTLVHRCDGIGKGRSGSWNGRTWFSLCFVSSPTKVMSAECAASTSAEVFFPNMFATSLSEQIQSIVTLSKDSPDENSNHAEFGEQNRL